jgi:hypothetical protein
MISSVEAMMVVVLFQPLSFAPKLFWSASLNAQLTLSELGSGNGNWVLTE